MGAFGESGPELVLNGIVSERDCLRQPATCRMVGVSFHIALLLSQIGLHSLRQAAILVLRIGTNTLAHLQLGSLSGSLTYPLSANREAAISSCRLLSNRGV